MVNFHKKLTIIKPEAVNLKLKAIYNCNWRRKREIIWRSAPQSSPVLPAPAKYKKGVPFLKEVKNQKGVLFKKDFQNLFSSFENTTVHPHSGKI